MQGKDANSLREDSANPGFCLEYIGFLFAENIPLLEDHLSILLANDWNSPEVVQGIDMVKNKTCQLAQYPENMRHCADRLIIGTLNICGGEYSDTH